MNDSIFYEAKQFYPQLISTLAMNDKSEADVLWVGNNRYRIPWTEFEELAIHIGQNELYYVTGDFWDAIPSDLLIVGKDFLIRICPTSDIFDPIWEYIPVPPCPEQVVHLESLVLPYAERAKRPYPCREPHTLDEQVI